MGSALRSEVRGVRIDVWPPFQRFGLDFEAGRGKGRRESRRETWIWVNRMIAVVLMPCVGRMESQNDTKP